VIVREFLNVHCRATRELHELTVRDVERFIAKKSKRRGRSALQAIVGSLRLFLRYCHDRKLLATRLDEIDTPRKYRDERPPRAIPWDLAQALLKSINRRSRMGCRDHAMLYLMTHYGLRTGEVCDLRLEDVDVARRVLRVKQSKTHQTLTLPMTEQATCLLRRYMEFGRPRTTLPHVFLSILAPLRPVFRSSWRLSFSAE
jgi:integrase